MAGIGKEEEMAAQEKTENKEEKMDEGGGEDSEGDVYEVEKIVGMSAKEGKTVYRVRWQGYSPSWDTWEPYENLVSCRDMIDAYMDDLNKKKSPVKVQTPDFNPEVFSQEESSDHDSIVSKGSSTTSSANSRKKKEKKQTYYYVPGSDDEADTLKDKFWRDLEQGKINVFGNDLYSKVKSQGRAARPATFRESSQEMLPPEETPDKPAKKLKRQDSKGSGSSKSGKTHKRQSSGDSHPTKASAGKGKGKGKKSRKSSLQDKNVEFGEEESEVQEHVSVDEWLISSDNEEETNTKSSHVVPAQPDTSGRSVPQPDTSGRSVPQPDTSGRSVPQPDTNSKQVKLEPTDSQVGCVKPTPIPDKPTALSVQYKSKRTASRREMSSEMSSVSDMVVYSEPPTSPVHCTASSARDEVAMTITSPPGGNVCAKDNVCKKWLDNDPKLRSCVVVLEKVAWHKIAARMAALSTQDSGDECTSEQKSHDATPAGSGDRSTLIKLRARSSGWAIVPASEEEHIVKLKETSPAEVVTTASMVGSGSRTQSGGTQSTSTTMGSNGQQQQRVLRRRQSSGAVQAPITAATAPAAQPNHNLSVCQISVNAERSKVRDEISEIKMDVNSNQNVQADHNKRKSDTDSESQKRVRTDAHSDKFTSEKKVDNESNNEGKALQDKKVTRGDSKAAMNKSSESQKSPEVSYQVTNYKALFRQQGQVAGRQPELPTKQDLPREPTPRISSQHTPVASTAKDSPAPSCSTPGVENPYNDVDMRRMPVSGSDLATPLQRLAPATGLQSSHPPQQSPAVQGRPSSVTSLHSHSPQQSPVVQGRPSSVTSLHSHSPQQSPAVQGLYSLSPQQSPTIHGRPSSTTVPHSQSPASVEVASLTQRSVGSPAVQPTLHQRSNSLTSPHTPLTPITPGMGGEETFDFDLDDLSPGIWDKRLPDKRQGDGTEYTNTDLKKAIWENNYELVRRAFSCGKHFDVEQPDNIGLTLLMVTAQCGFDDVLELLVLNGANINARTKNGATALMLACEQGHRCTVELLLTMGAHMNLQQANGETALIKAVKRGNGHVVRILLDNGVNFTCNHSNGTNENTAIKLAQQLQLPEVTEIINAHMSRVKSEFESQVYITLNNTAKILYPLFPIHCFAVSEGDKFTIHFHHDLQPTRQGVGMLLFIAHARITSSEIKCRFYGPCAVNSSSLNGIVLHPLTEEANFVMSFTPLQHGRNTVDIYTAGAPRSKAKLIVCAYKAQLTMPPD